MLISKSKGTSTSPPDDKVLKASNFQASVLRIGSWEFVSRHEGDLVARFYFKKHQIVWEVLDCCEGLRSKMEIQWSDITALKADSTRSTLTLTLARKPAFFKEIDPRPRKKSAWSPTTDFTGGQATLHMQHYLQSPIGVLDKHFENLLLRDTRLAILSRQPALHEIVNVEGSQNFFGHGGIVNRVSEQMTSLPSTTNDVNNECIQCRQLKSLRGAHENLIQCDMRLPILSQQPADGMLNVDSYGYNQLLGPTSGIVNHVSEQMTSLPPTANDHDDNANMQRHVQCPRGFLDMHHHDDHIQNDTRLPILSRQPADENSILNVNDYGYDQQVVPMSGENHISEQMMKGLHDYDYDNMLLNDTGWIDDLLQEEGGNDNFTPMNDFNITGQQEHVMQRHDSFEDLLLSYFGPDPPSII